MIRKKRETERETIDAIDLFYGALRFGDGPFTSPEFVSFAQASQKEKENQSLFHFVSFCH